MKRIPWIWLLFAGFLIYFIFFIRKDIIDNLALKRDVKTFKAKLEQAHNSSRELNNRLHRLAKGDLVEEIARTKLGMIKQTEIAYKVTN